MLGNSGYNTKFIIPIFSTNFDLNSFYELNFIKLNLNDFTASQASFGNALAADLRDVKLGVFNSEYRIEVGCPDNLGPFSADPGTCDTEVIYVPPTADGGLLGTMELMTALGTGDRFPIGVTTVIYEEQISGIPTGNICTFEVTVVDDEDPVIPTLLAVTVDCGGTLSVPTTTDVCAGTIIGTTSDALYFVEGGSTIINWTFDDGNGNVITVPQTYNYDDTTVPVTPTLPDVTVDCDGTLSVPTTTDVCAGTITGTTSDALYFIEGGSTIINWTFSDGNGNVITVPQTYNYDDTTVPVTPTLPNVTVDCDGTLSAPTTTDACSGSIIGTTTDTLSFLEGGSTTITWTFDDGNGNSTTEEQIYNYDDTTDPVTSALNNVTDQCSVTITPPTTLDNCGGTVIGTTSTTFPITTQGTTVVTWTFDDGNSNSITQTQNIIITDITAPVPNLTNLPDVPAQCSVTSLTPPTATDNCGGAVTVTNNAALPITAQGTTVVVWTYQDVNGNTSTQNQNIIITDNTAPVPNLTNLPDVPAQCSVTSLTPPTATDNCGGAVTVTNNAALPIAAQGTTVVVWTYQDVNGNTSTQNQNIIITDNTAPVPNLPNLPDVPAQCSVTSLTPPTATDNCSGQITGTTSDPSNYTSQGTYTVTWTYDDNHGNISTQTQSVIVDDTIAPVPNVSSLPTVTGQCSATLTAPSATDNCSGQITGTTPDPTNYTSQGTYTVTWKYDDNNGNISTQTQTVIVDDTIAPVPNVSSLPTITGQCSVTLTTPSATDNCGQIIGTTSYPTSYTSQGTYTVTWTYNDNNGNISTQTQIIIIEDTISPNIPNLPDLVGDCSLTVTPPTTIDNCDGTITGTTGLTSLIFNTIGTDIIFWEFTDVVGNSIIVPQNITITDGAPVPNLSVLPPQVYDGCQIMSINSLEAPTATDVCDGVIIGTLSSNFIFPYSFSGTQTIDWEFIDSNGNLTVQSQDVTLNPITVNGGTLNGTYLSTVFSEGIDISTCAVAIDVELNLSGEIGTIIQWEKYAVNQGVWQVISNTSNNYTASFGVGALVSTYYKVLIQTGTCLAYSDQFLIQALPVGSAPTITNLDPDAMYCLGEAVSLLATSNFTATQEAIANSSGNFNHGQLNTQDPDGWLVDGEPGGFTAGGSATKPRNWSAKTCNNQANGEIVYCSNEGKYSIAYGNYFSNQYRGAIPTTLETPIMDFSNAESASLDFDQAYYFSNNDYAKIEVSTNGGATYSTLRLMHTPGTGSVNWYTAGTAESVVGSSPTHYNFNTDNTSIDLSAYLGLNNVRIRWSFTGTTNQSTWAMDNIFVNKEVVVDTELEWTDGIGDPNIPPIADGTSSVAFVFTPDAPGHHQYGTTALVNDCRTYEENGTALIDIYVSYSYAGENIAYSNEECGQTTVQLNAYDNRISARDNATKGAFTIPTNCINCDDEGTGEEGVWSISENSSCGGGSFSDVTDPDALFTAEAGTYTLSWTVAGCTSSMTVTTTSCNQVDFDGTNDHVDFGNNNFHFNSGSFSIETWVKPEVISGNQTIFSKRNGNGNNSGYDLSVNELGTVSFNINTLGSISSFPYTINTNRWYHIAVTFSDGRYRLYIDGVLVKQNTASWPLSNTFRALLGAMDDNTINSPKNYFNGWIDEFRIWNVGLSDDQLHQMMNQKIRLSPTNAGKVQGEIIPVDINGLTWSNLTAYYQMEPAQLSCGYLQSTSSTIKGKLKNIASNQSQTAPIPYTSATNGNWYTDNTWTYPDVWDAPNSLGIDGTTRIDWNIARTNHDIISDNRDVTLLGLLVDSNELTITGAGLQNETNTGTGLWITHYLKIDGKIDLVGESQLVQKRYTPSQIGESLFASNSTGYIERDQQGTGNPFNYNYWGSPVSPGNASVTSANVSTNTYSIGSILFDGTIPRTDPINFPVGWTTGYTAASTPTAAQVSSLWIYTYANNAANTYSEWGYVSNTTPFTTGLGFSMKGSGADTEPFTGAFQNYVFIGKPNNGTIITSVSPGNDALVGNPYPSALDANQFIKDNRYQGTGTGSIDGTLYFWEHFLTNNTHVLTDYIGGYATYNLSGGLHAITPPMTTDGYIILGGNGTRRPERYVPVSQGFFVSSSLTGGTIVFNNNQRAFRREAVTGGVNNGSLFFRTTNSVADADSNDEDALMQRIRLKFESPEGFERPLLLAFEPNNLATDGVDYGYDALNNDAFPSDLLWLIEGAGYVIQGVGAFDITKQYPLMMNLAINGEVKISLTDLENFDPAIDVFIYDALLDTYTQINTTAFQMTLDTGSYLDRFYLAFTSDALSIDDPIKSTVIVNYLNESDEIFIKIPNNTRLDKVHLINLLGQSIQTWDQRDFETYTNELRIPVKNVSEGNYIIKVETETTSINKKIIIKY